MKQQLEGGKRKDCLKHRDMREMERRKMYEGNTLGKCKRVGKSWQEMFVILTDKFLVIDDFLRKG